MCESITANVDNLKVYENYAKYNLIRDYKGLDMVETRNIPSPGPIPDVPVVVSNLDPIIDPIGPITDLPGGPPNLNFDSDHTVEESTILLGNDNTLFSLVNIFRDFQFPTGPNFINNGQIWLTTLDGGRAINSTNASSVVNNGLIVSVSLSEQRGPELVGGSSSGVATGVTIGSGADFENTGDIFAISMGGFSLGLSSFVTEGLTNSGNIYAEAAFDATGIFDGNSINLDNDGTIISSAGRDARAISTGANGSVNNSGLIRAISDRAGPEQQEGVGIGIEFFISGDIVNSGTIEADFAILSDISGQSFLSDFSNFSLNNSGTIIGVISSGGGDDILDNSGSITGNVFLGNGNDMLSSELGQITGDVFGGDGNDIIRLGLGNDFIDGGSGQDQLFGGAGNDLLIGGRGDDTLVGGVGNDSFSGGYGNDILTLSGGDRAFGNDQDDIFIVSDGQFQLIDGGNGQDSLLFANQGQTLDLSTFIDAGRITSIEEVQIEAGSGVAISAANAGNLSDNSDIFVSGLGTLTLYDGWSVGNTVERNGITFIEYTAGLASILAAEELSVTLTSAAPTNSITPQEFLGQAAIDPPEIQVDFTAEQNQFFTATDDFTVFDVETYRAVSSDGAFQSPVVFRLQENQRFDDGPAVFTNNGSIIAEGTSFQNFVGFEEIDLAFGIVVTGFNWDVENFGLISASSTGNISQGLFSDSGNTVRNFGDIIATSGNSRATGVNVRNTDVINTGTISATTENLGDFPDFSPTTAVILNAADLDNSGMI